MSFIIKKKYFELFVFLLVLKWPLCCYFFHLKQLVYPRVLDLAVTEAKQTKANNPFSFCFVVLFFFYLSIHSTFVGFNLK